jgi:hypothetical protein
MRCGELPATTIDDLINRYRLTAVRVTASRPIPGSYWGEPEAGLRRGRLYWRPDTPVHSLLHELAHYVCMDSSRRSSLDTDAGGDDEEECAVCYLEVLLAGQMRQFGSDRCLADMDSWGYSFRQGSARGWFEGDGCESRGWLLRHGLIVPDGTPSLRLRN